MALWEGPTADFKKGGSLELLFGANCFIDAGVTVTMASGYKYLVREGCLMTSADLQMDLSFGDGLLNQTASSSHIAPMPPKVHLQLPEQTPPVFSGWTPPAAATTTRSRP